MWKVLILESLSFFGSSIVLVLDSWTGGWVEDMASPRADTGSTVAYERARRGVERRRVRVAGRRRELERSREAIVARG